MGLGKGAFHARCKRWKSRFRAGNQDLGVIGVLDNQSIGDVQAQVVGKRAEEDRAEARTLKNALVDGKRR